MLYIEQNFTFMLSFMTKKRKKKYMHLDPYLVFSSHTKYKLVK
jgi:hypothetical protein